MNYFILSPLTTLLRLRADPLALVGGEFTCPRSPKKPGLHPYSSLWKLPQGHHAEEDHPPWYRSCWPMASPFKEWVLQGYVCVVIMGTCGRWARRAEKGGLAQGLKPKRTLQGRWHLRAEHVSLEHEEPRFPSWRGAVSSSPLNV